MRSSSPRAQTVVIEPFGRLSDREFALCSNALCDRPHVFLRRAEGGAPDAPSWSFIASDPSQILVADATPAGRSSNPFAALKRAWPGRCTQAATPVPFVGGFAGYVGYEARSAVERTPPPRTPPDGFPNYWLGRYDAVLTRDGTSGLTYVTGVGADRPRANDACSRLLTRLFEGLARVDERPVLRSKAGPRSKSGPRSKAGRSRPRAPRSNVSPVAYRRRIDEVRRRIGRGDLFQANVSQRFEGRAVETGPELFERLVEASPTPFATYVDLGGGRAVLSTSPERFLAKRGDLLETRPMKGTRRRGATRAQDRVLERDLSTSEKDKAELAMIVDLARNDLSRSCRPGSVRVTTARRLERYATVHQAIAIVEGRLRGDVHPVEAVRQAFPPGSVTGAPKVEAMNVIDAVEGEARGPYCGAIGWFDERGDFDLAVAIRTVCLSGSKVSYRVGGGVTWLSDPEAERVETVDKGRAIARAVQTGATRKRTS